MVSYCSIRASRKFQEDWIKNDDARSKKRFFANFLCETTYPEVYEHVLLRKGGQDHTYHDHPGGGAFVQILYAMLGNWVSKF